MLKSRIYNYNLLKNINNTIMKLSVYIHIYSYICHFEKIFRINLLNYDEFYFTYDSINYDKLLN
jgi:hypothetical protein